MKTVVNQKSSDEKEIRVNHQIKADKVRVIGTDGEQLGIMDVPSALKLAKERELDLVEVAPNANPPVCKILDFGKYKFQLAKKDRESRKKQAHSEVKKIRFTPVTGDNDFEVKVRQAKEFIKDGHKVKAIVMLRGRLMTRREMGDDILQRFIEAMSSVAKVEVGIQMDGVRSMSVQLMKK
ncbi:MAG: translation initiation factor IF-3 [bacterium]|nr:translation initiation factor IF-3 [bacterium]